MIRINMDVNEYIGDAKYFFRIQAKSKCKLLYEKYVQPRNTVVITHKPKLIRTLESHKQLWRALFDLSCQSSFFPQRWLIMTRKTLVLSHWFQHGKHNDEPLSTNTGVRQIIFEPLYSNEYRGSNIIFWASLIYLYTTWKFLSKAD